MAPVPRVGSGALLGGPGLMPRWIFRVMPIPSAIEALLRLSENRGFPQNGHGGLTFAGCGPSACDAHILAKIALHPVVALSSRIIVGLGLPNLRSSAMPNDAKDGIKLRHRGQNIPRSGRASAPSIESSSLVYGLRSLMRGLTLKLSHTRPATLEKQNGPSPACWL